MSSSKIYDNTSSFHPEVLVSSESRKETGWQSNLQDIQSSEYAARPLFSDSEPAKQPEPESLETVEDYSDNVQQDPIVQEEKTEQHNNVDEQTVQPSLSQDMDPLPSQENSEKFLQELEREYKRGIDDGLQQAENDFKTSAQALISIAEQLNNTREIILQNSMSEMQDLTITIAEKIIRHSITTQDDTIIATIEEGIRQAVKSDEFYICINEGDYDVLNEKIPDIISKISGLENIFIKIDNNIEPGGCMIESDNCTVDATIASQLEIITDQIKNRR